MKEIERIRPKKILIENHKKLSIELQKQRKSILDELSATRADRSARFVRALKRLNKRLAGKLRLEVKAEFDRKPVVDFLLSCKLDGIGEARLAWIKEADDRILIYYGAADDSICFAETTVDDLLLYLD